MYNGHKVQQVRRILQAVSDSANLHGAVIVQCTGTGTKVNVTLCCVGHADGIVSVFRTLGMIVAQDGIDFTSFTVSFPTDKQRRFMQ